MKKIIFTILILNTTSFVWAQTFDPLSLFGKGKPLKLNGGINATAIYNYASANNSNPIPFNYVVGGNLNVYFKGINIPLDFAYSNTQFSYNFQPIPFNRIAIHPKYKIATLHAGSIALTFSPYTLNGAQFNGAGIELAPKKWKFTVLGGKFLKGSGNYLDNPDIQPSYARWGQGASASYQFKNITVGANFFHAKDDTTSATNIPVETGVTPKQNIVSSIVSNGNIKGIKFSVEVANSFITNNLTTQAAYKGGGVFSKRMSTNSSTASNYASKAQLNYLVEKIQLDAGFTFERVDFNYQTLGTLYNINGFQNMGVTLAKPFLNGKLNVNTQIGVQKDIGDDTTISQQSNRLLGSFNINYNPIQKLSLNASYSNTRGVTNIRNLDNIANQNNLIPQFLDSLRLVQLNQNANFSANYQLKATAEQNSALNFNYSFQKGDQKQGDFFVDLQGSVFHNTAINFLNMLPKQDVKWSVGFNYSKIKQGPDSNNTKAIGVNFNFGKKVFKKQVTLTVGSGYNTTQIVANALQVNVINFRLSAAYVLLKKHVFNLNTIFQNQTRKGISLPFTSNSTGVMNISYNYNF
jgi:hypothetical protein